MSDMRNWQVRATEYHRLAAMADGLALASPLAHVREKHARAAASWTALATLSEQSGRDLRRRTQQARRAVSPEALSPSSEDIPCIA